MYRHTSSSPVEDTFQADACAFQQCFANPLELCDVPSVTNPVKKLISLKSVKELVETCKDLYPWQTFPSSVVENVAVTTTKGLELATFDAAKTELEKKSASTYDVDARRHHSPHG